MLWDAKIEGTITVQAIIDMIKELLAKIFGFIADEEGWVEEEATEEEVA